MSPLKNKLKTLKKLTKKQQGEIRENIVLAHNNYHKGLNSHALYKTHDLELSHDLVQTTFLKTLIYLQKGGKIDVMRSFLNRILRDLIIDEYRKNKTSSLDIMLDKGFEPSTDNFDKVIDILDGKEVIALIHLLPKKYQTVLKMRYLQGLSLTEMSLLTGQTQNTVAVQAHRGVELLKVLYQKSHPHS
jgi:RNA polymerase sigma-70 factor (ECF subfamily)